MVSPRGTKPYLLIIMLALSVFFSMCARVIFSPLMPSLRDSLNFGLSVAGSLFLLVSVAYGISMLLSGFISCKIGHVRTVFTALILIASGLLISALAPTIPLLACGMALTGTGGGLYT